MDELGERREKKRPSVVADFAESEGRDDTTTSKNIPYMKRNYQ
ncbi:hypothetical protein [Shouchella clausii]|nr:hypothetical protein [Shouchella clausii]MCY1104497.1 hypothetical protein [Shouchella clausii]MEB5475061.1 hypothetical protein [Shouchella clausii]MEB5481757.1 hypothetical protein [Shouchella clausii]WQG97175.1 hypothetical protein SR921_10770 [Shouchella clausii]